MKQITLQVNRTTHTVEVDPDTPLLFVLNDELGLRGPRFGCGMAQCGACTVIMRGQVVRSCVMPVRAVGHAEITTLEGLGTPGKPHPIQQAFIDAGAVQCGFCTPGLIMQTHSFLRQSLLRRPDGVPADSDIREALAGNLCRCTGYEKILDAVRLAAARMTGVTR